MATFISNPNCIAMGTKRLSMRRRTLYRPMTTNTVLAVSTPRRYTTYVTKVRNTISLAELKNGAMMEARRYADL